MTAGRFSRRAVLLAAAALPVAGARAAAPARIVTLGGVVTEIAFALGAGDKVVGVDDSSLFPSAAQKLPKVGYYRGFSIEGVASLLPDLVLASDQAGPPQALEQLRRLGKPVVMLPSAPSVDALVQRIAGVADALGAQPAGEQLVTRIRAEVAAAAKAGAGQQVLLVSSRGGKFEGAGRETAADAILTLAGARNVLAAERGYKALSAEGAVALKPDVIVTTTMSLQASGGLDAFLAQPGIAVTPAGRARRVVVMDDLLLLGFGPRLPEALRQLQDGLAGRR